eukprot:1472364-Rhodomonas_salina.2
MSGWTDTPRVWTRTGGRVPERLCSDPDGRPGSGGGVWQGAGAAGGAGGEAASFRQAHSCAG